MFIIIIFCVTLLFAVLALLTYVELNRQSMNRKFSHIPGPKQLPIIGNMYITNATNISDFNCYVEELSKARVVKMMVPGHLILGISDPVILQEILNAPEFLGRVKYFVKFSPWKEAMLTAACKYFFSLT